MMIMVKGKPSIRTIRGKVRSELFGYFNALAAEFPGYVDKEKSLEDITVLLAAGANHNADEIIAEFNSLQTKKDVVNAYARAHSRVSGDDKLYLEVKSVADELNIPLSSVGLGSY